MTTTAPALDVREIAPDRITPDPDNPRNKLRDIDELAASIKEHGVLDPITVRPDPAANGSGPTWIVVRGHRRHAAAVKAGVELMPCIVDHSDDARRRAATRMVENLQRDDLTALEEARGVQQLLDLGISEEDVASSLSVPTDRVARAQRIQASKTIAKAGAVATELSFDDAAAIAEFDDQPKVAKSLLATIQKEPEYFASELEQFRQEREDQRLTDAKVEELKAAGYKILKDRPWGYRDYDQGSKEKPIQYLRADAAAGKPLTSAAHKSCPGRCAHVETDDGKVVVTEACVDWKANGHVPLSSRSSPTSSSSGSAAKPKKLTPAQQKAQEKEKQERRIHMACIKAGRAAEVVRRRFVSELLGRKSLPKGIERYVTEAIVTGYHRIEPHTTVFGELTGLDTKKARRVSDGTVYSEFVKSLSDTTVVFGLLAYVAAEREDQFAPNNWQRPGAERLAYLRFLVSAGYKPSLVEKVQLGEAKPAEVLAEAERIKEASKS